MFILGKKLDESIVHVSGTYNIDPTIKQVLFSAAQRGEIDISSLQLVFTQKDGTVIRPEIVSLNQDGTITSNAGTAHINNESIQLVTADYSIAYFGNESVTAKRILNGDQYTVSWVNNEIDGVDFTSEDTKKLIKVSIDKTEINGDKVDTATLTVELWKADNSGIANTITADVSFPVNCPTRRGVIYTPLSIVNGVGTIAINTDIYGKWIFPGENKRYKNFRIVNQVSLDVRVIL